MFQDQLSRAFGQELTVATRDTAPVRNMQTEEERAEHGLMYFFILERKGIQLGKETEGDKMWGLALTWSAEEKRGG